MSYSPIITLKHRSNSKASVLDEICSLDLGCWKTRDIYDPDTLLYIPHQRQNVTPAKKFPPLVFLLWPYRPRNHSLSITSVTAVPKKLTKHKSKCLQNQFQQFDSNTAAESPATTSPVIACHLFLRVVPPVSLTVRRLDST